MTKRQSAERRVILPDAPERIWLQLGPDKPDANAKFSDYGEVTWCADSIDDYDIEYKRVKSSAKSGRK